MTMLGAKRALEEMLARGRAYVTVPTVEDIQTLTSELTDAGVAARLLPNHPTLDVKAIRERLALSQEQFALRFGLDVATVRNWETGRRQPGRAAHSYLRVIAREPAMVEDALADV